MNSQNLEISINKLLVIFILFLTILIFGLISVLLINITRNTANSTISRNSNKTLEKKVFSSSSLNIQTTSKVSSSITKNTSLMSSLYTTSDVSTTTSISLPIDIFTQISQIDAKAKLDIPILMFHHIDPGDYSQTDPIRAGLTVSPDMFEKDLQYLKDNGYTTIWPEEIFDKLAHKDEGKYVVITLDDGYEDNYTYALPLLKKYDMKAIIYIITDLVGGYNGNKYLTWDEIVEEKNTGLIKFGSHSVSHPNLANTNESEQRRQLAESKKILEEKLGYPIRDFCYPSGKYNDTTIKLLRELGYTNATTVNYGQGRNVNNSYEWSRFRVFGDHVIRL